MHKTLASRLSARFQADNTHFAEYQNRSPVLRGALLEDLILQDQIIIPVPDFTTAAGLILLIGERGMIEMLEAERVKFVRTRASLAFVRGSGPDGGIVVAYDPTHQRPTDAPLDKAIAAGIDLVRNALTEYNLLTKLILKSSCSVESLEILKAVKNESLSNFKQTTTWTPAFAFDNPELLCLPGIQKMEMKVIGMTPDPLRAPIDTLLEIVSYNADIFLAAKFDAADLSPFFPIGDLLRIKALASEQKRESLWSLFEVNGIPDVSCLDLAQSGRFEALFKASNSSKAKAFRTWFHSREAWDGNEIIKEYIDILTQVPWTQRLPTRILRFIVTTALGAIPIVGHAASVADAFLIDSLAGRKSPKCFIDNLRQLGQTMGLTKR